MEFLRIGRPGAHSFWEDLQALAWAFVNLLLLLRRSPCLGCKHFCCMPVLATIPASVDSFWSFTAHDKDLLMAPLLDVIFMKLCPV